MSLLTENVATVVTSDVLETDILNMPVDTVYTDGLVYETFYGTVNLATTMPVNNYYLVIDDATGQPLNMAGKLIQNIYFSTSPAITGTDLTNLFFENRQLSSTNLAIPLPFWYSTPSSAPLLNEGVYLEYADFYSLGSVTNGYPYMSLFNYNGTPLPVPTVTGGVIHLKVVCTVL